MAEPLPPAATTASINPTSPPPRSPSASPSPDPDADMLAAMGFASFGSTSAIHNPRNKTTFENGPAAKKRRHNPTPDSSAGNGANAIPLGMRKPKAQPQTHNGVDINSGSGSGDALDARIAEILREGSFKEGDPGYEDEDGPPPSPPPLAGGKEGNRGKDNGDEASGTELATAPENTLPPPSSLLSTLPPNPFSGAGDSVTLEHSGMVISRTELNALRRGVRNQKGDMVFFDLNFLEDPWKGLEPKELPPKPGRREGRG